YGVSKDDLREIPANWVWDREETNIDTAYDVAELLRKKYTGTTSYEFDHIHSEKERDWFLEQIEATSFEANLSDDEKKHLLERLIKVESFEQFLHKTFVGQKRFSIEGLETMVPVLDEIVKAANSENVENIMMGMAHRGR